MKRLQIPKNILWLFLCGTLFVVLMTVLRIVFLQVFTPPSGTPALPYLDTFVMGLRFDARVLAVVCLLLWLTGFVPALHVFRTRSGRYFGLAIWSLFIVIAGIFYAVDFANYAYLNERLNAGLLNYVADARTSVRMMWETYPVIKILAAIAIALVVLRFMVRALFRTVAAKESTATRKSNLVWHTAFFLLLAFLIFGRVGQYPLRWSDAFTLGNDYASNVALNPFQSFLSSLQFRNSTYEADKVKKAYPYMVQYLGITDPDSNKLNYTRVVKPDITLSKQPNVVVVICESFSAYKSSMYGNPLNTTPYFAGMCAQGIFFSRCFTPSYGTARGVWTTITGIPDVALSKTSSRNPAAVNQHTIMNDFKGYEKFYMIGGSLSWANIRGILTNNIHDLHIYEQDDYDAAKVDVWGVSDKNLFLSANTILAKQKGPFIAVLQTADNHRPYTIPEEDKAEFNILNPPQDSLRHFGFESADEYNAFRYTDFCFRKFIEAAKKEAYFNNTIFVFVGDHGIGGDAGNMFPMAWTQELTSMHVPLLFYAPALIAPATYSFPVTQCDVMPTVAGLSKIAYTNTTLGRDMLSPAVQQHPEIQAAFIYNPDKRRIGIVQDSIFYSYGIERKLNEQVWSTSGNLKPALSPARKDQYYDITEAYYQTARYMLLHNKAE